MEMFSKTILDSAKVATQAVNSAHEDDLAKRQSPANFNLKLLAATELLLKKMNLQLQGAELMEALQSQLEYYFSRKNLANDTYLLSQMDSQQYVAINIIAKFNAIKKLTCDIDLVVIALRCSSKVEVDQSGKKVRPKKRRYIVILREIPDIADGSHVMGIFNRGPAKFLSCEFAGNGSWYIFFESEDDARAACRYLREKIMEFMGKPIKARVKLETYHQKPYCYHLLQKKLQEEGNLNPMTNIFTPNNGGYITPQVTSTPLEYLHPQKVLLSPQPPFSSTAYPGVGFPSFLTQMTIPNVATVTSNGAAPHPAANTSFNRFPVAPWQGANFYPPQDSQHPSTITTPLTYLPPQVTRQPLQLQHDSIHPTQYHRGHADNNKFANPAINR